MSAAVHTMKSHAVIVGAGPVGAVAALILARHGIRVTLIERNGTLLSMSRASTFHPSTLDLLLAQGIDLAGHPAATTVTSLQWRNRDGEVLAELDYRLLTGLTNHPYRIHLDQQILLDRLAELIDDEPEIDFRCATEVVALDPARPAITTVTTDGRRRTLTADVIIGCDGSHSLIRQQAGIRLSVLPYPTRALRAHTDADLSALLPESAPQPLSGLCYFRDGGDGVSALRVGNHNRLIVRGAPGQPDVARVAEAVANATPWNMDALAVQRIDGYLLGRGVVDSYFSDLGPVLVIGDAAHVTSTAGGMNMNSGIHDAFAVMPALAGRLRGGTDPLRVAHIAEARRRYMLEEVIPRTERRVRGLQDRDRTSFATHLHDLAPLVANRAARRRFLIEASLLDAPLPGFQSLSS